MMKWLAIVFLCIPLTVLTAQDPVSLMELWDYGNPAATREKFRERLSEVNRSDDRNLLVALLSQIAITYSLQGEFRTAHAELDAILPLVDDRQTSGYVLYLLERGRTFNSAGKRQEAAELFHRAFDIARDIGHDYLAVDAAHMLAIALPLDEQMAWNRRALEIAEESQSESARDWLGTLYNNMG
ncbi:MAG: hypothetical protein HUJ31_07460, partial [Pseudomonadales bacterium]|nr:hypothetical protein [Pseudomonadales bacterium]